jgi:hypothetical protein
MAFKKGQSGNPKGGPKGGHPGCGRPADWLRQKCQDILEQRKLVEFMADVASGEYLETVVIDGERPTKLKRSADVQYRIKAVEYLTDRGYGKSVTPMEHSGLITLEQVLCGAEGSE